MNNYIEKGKEPIRLVQANINIKVTENLKEKLNDLKVHPREPYHEVITRLLEFYEKNND